MRALLASTFVLTLSACGLVSGLSELEVGGPDASVVADAADEDRGAPQDSAVDVRDALVMDAGLLPLKCGPTKTCLGSVEKCCVDDATKNGVCVPLGSPCMTDAAFVLTCDHGAQCNQGQVCCANTSASTSITCKLAADCPSMLPSAWLCASASECSQSQMCTQVPTATWLSFCN